ncbi:MAG: DUF3347 domain-containing protein [Acidobacteria bacterium]|nr:DUF3347 domain-containing protein [Acidobacteriota bacterium]
MKKMLLLAVVGLVLGAGSAAAELPAEVAAPYLHIQATLAADSTDGVGEAAQSIVAAAGDLGDAGAAIVMAANAVSLADDLVKTRAAFGLLSDAVIKFSDAAGLGELKVAFCPMARKSWIQEDGDIANPYHGSEMLRCGSFRPSR